MSEIFTHDVFLSHSSKDKTVARALAERLRGDGVRVWFDEWEIKPGDSIPAKQEEGLERSRVLVLCMSANAFAAEWSQLEAGTFRFRDPMNKERRFIPLRLDDALARGALGQFLYINWQTEEQRGEEYAKVLEACGRVEAELPSGQQEARDRLEVKIRSLGHTASVRSVAWSPDGKWAISGSEDKTLRVWDVDSVRCVRALEGHADRVLSVMWSPDGKQAISASEDKTLRVWEIDSGRCVRVLEGHTDRVWSVAWSSDGKRALSGSSDRTVRVWEVGSGRCVRALKGHNDIVLSVAWSGDGKRAISGSEDTTVLVWDIESGRRIQVLQGHFGGVNSVAWSRDGWQVLSGGDDNTVRLWDVKSGWCLRVFEGHTDRVWSVVWSVNGKRALSGSSDHTMRVWDVGSGRCVRLLEGHTARVWSVAWSPDGKRALSGSLDRTMRLWKMDGGRDVRIVEGHTDKVLSLAWSGDGKRALSWAEDKTVRIWEIDSGRCVRVLAGQTAKILSIALSEDGKWALFGCSDKNLRVWDVDEGRCVQVLEGHADTVLSVAWSKDRKCAVSGSSDKTVRVWKTDGGRCVRVLEGHTARILSVAWSSDGKHALSGSEDRTVRLWEIASGRCLRVLEGHTARVLSVAWSSDGKHALSGSEDKTVRLWEVESGRCLRVLEGHTDVVSSLSWSFDGKRALSASEDKTVLLWELDSGRCLRVLGGHADRILSVAWSPDGKQALSGAENGVWREWNLTKFVIQARPTKGTASVVPAMPDQVQYTNAKVLLVGESGVGKTGLSNYLAHEIKVSSKDPLPSTDGAWTTHWVLHHERKKDGMEREIWLWDFAGQVDYRLVQQLFMDDAAAAVLVFDPQKEDLFEGLGRWERDLQKAARKPFAKLLAAGRVDRGGLTVSVNNVKKFMKERSFTGTLHETSAKTGEGCERLREAIVKAIDWKSIPETTSPALYHRMKQEILNLRDSGLALIRLAELKQRMEMTLHGEGFKPAELEAVVSLLAGPGMIQELDFGEFILLRPEVLSRYAAAVVRKVRQHPQELGCIRESELLAGILDYQDFKRLENREDERVVLRALLDHFISRAWCLRLPCEDTAMLTFPSYFRREREEQPSHPNVLVTYRFDGLADDIYATLVVRLHHTVAFESTDLWKSAADFKTQTEKKLGFALEKKGEGRSRLEIYFAPDVDENSRVLFLRYVGDHLAAHAKNVERLRHYSCAYVKCRDFGKRFTNQEAIDEALASDGEGKVFCAKCGRPINLRDVIEKKFESPQMKAEAAQMQAESQAVIDSESKDLILTGHAISITGEAGQIYRGYTGGDHGIDGEIEFKDDRGRASGKRLYVQLKSGDSYLTTRRRDGVEVFQIKKGRWADYWQAQHYLVMLVIRTSDGVIRWMEVSEYLKRESAEGKAVKQIEFKGERFDALSVQNWRKRVLAAGR